MLRRLTHMHQYEFPLEPSSMFRRFLVVMLVVLGLAGGLATVGAALGIPPMAALATESVSDDWSFASGSSDDLRAIAMQVCGAEALALSSTGTESEEARKAHLLNLTAEYKAAEQAYNQQVRALVATGLERPSSVESKALPIDLAKATYCLRTEKSLPLATPTPVLSELPPLAGWGSRVHRLSEEELDHYAAIAGWPNEPGWWPDMRRIIMCESGRNIFAHNTSDPYGGSWGLAQLNGRYHFDRAGEDFEQRFDPVVNLRTALWLRTARGHFGGGGGWKLCSDLLGID